MFIKVAIEDVDPMVVMVLRCGLGAIPLWMTAAWLRRRRGDRLAPGVVAAARARPGALLALGALTAVPLWLVGIGEEHIDSGLAGVVNASVPLWAAALALRFDPLHPSGPRRMAGVAVGFAGVVGLAIARGSLGGGSEAAGIAAVAVASCMYAAGAILVRQRLADLPSVETAAWSVSVAAVTFAPVALVSLPADAPSANAIGAIAALAVLGTFLGFLAYYELLARVGAARATMVTYLLPPLAIGYGWLLLDEQIGAESLAAMAVILAGVWLGTREERDPAVTTGIAEPALSEPQTPPA